MKVRDAIALQRQHGISGLPVVEGGKLVGIVTNRDLRFEENLDQPLRNIMTPQDRLVTMKEGATLDEAQALMHKHRLERVLIVNDGFELRGLATVKDIVKNTEHPVANKDALGQLRVGAAVGVGAGTEERVEKLVAAGVDVLIVDTAHGHPVACWKACAGSSRISPVEVIGGNIATAAAARWSSTAPTASRSASAPAPSAPPASSRAWACRRSPRSPTWPRRWKARACRSSPTAASATGRRGQGHRRRRLRLHDGRHVRRHGRVPGEVVLFQGRSYKSYRGMGSLGAMTEGSADRYFQDPANNADKLVPEGIEGRVPYKGSVLAIIYQLVGGIRASMATARATIDDMRTKTEFVEITSAGVRESHVHDVQITGSAQLPRRLIHTVNYNVSITHRQNRKISQRFCRCGFISIGRVSCTSASSSWTTVRKSPN